MDEPCSADPWIYDRSSERAKGKEERSQNCERGMLSHYNYKEPTSAKSQTVIKVMDH